MKVLIWVGCLFISATIQVITKDNGVSLGGIPTAMIFLVTWWSAETLCKKWDNHKKIKTRTTDPCNSRFTECPKCGYIALSEIECCPKCGFTHSIEVQETNNPVEPRILYCRKCGAKLLEDAHFCKECGTEMIAKVEDTQNPLQ